MPGSAQADEATWSTIFEHAVTPRVGRNSLEIRAINYYGPPNPDVNPAGLIYQLDVGYSCSGRSCCHRS